MRSISLASLLAVLALTLACSDDPVTPADGGSPDAAARPDAAAEDAAAADADSPDVDTTPDAEPLDSGVAPDSGTGSMCSATAVPCQDESIQELGLFRAPNAATITNTATTGGFISQIDATAGGATPTRSYVYIRFTEAGMERVDVGDEAAFESTAWDMAMRRFVVRLNSGVSGPSCVTARRAAPNLSFDEIDTVPTTPARVEEYMTPAPACALVSDGSGLPGSPGVALQSYWEYPGCVKMTGNVYVVSLADGRHVKLQVLSYYSPANQLLCDTESRVNMPSGSGALRMKWAFLP